MTPSCKTLIRKFNAVKRGTGRNYRNERPGMNYWCEFTPTAKELADEDAGWADTRMYFRSMPEALAFFITNDNVEFNVAELVAAPRADVSEVSGRITLVRSNGTIELHSLGILPFALLQASRQFRPYLYFDNVEIDLRGSSTCGPENGDNESEREAVITGRL
jgi:hypothetical protein